MKKELLSLVRTVAPGIATALGGPYAGMAVRTLSDTLLGKPDGSRKDIEMALLGATPETMLKIKEADNNFVLDMERLGVDLVKLEADDRKDARASNRGAKDKTPAALGVLCFMGFFGILAALMFIEIPTASRGALTVMLGSLGTIVVQVANYYWGSSKSSAQKNDTIAGLMK